MNSGPFLPRHREWGPMPFLIAATMFFVLLASAAAVGLSDAARRIEGNGKIIVQVMATDPSQREAETQAALRMLEPHEAVGALHRVADTEMRELLEPWLGEAGLLDIPLPIIIEIDPLPGADTDALVAAVRHAAPSAAVNEGENWLTPVGRLIDLLRWLAAFLIILAVAAGIAVTILAARSELDLHRETVGLLHLMGATDHQIIRHFERRIALGALAGGLMSLLAVLPVLLLVGARMAELQSDIWAAGPAPLSRWALLLLPPLLGGILALLVARIALLRALRRYR